MNVDDQISLVERLMLRLAPEVARYSLRILEFQRSHLRTDEEETELFTTMARRCAQLTLELAMHLAGAYARFHDETQEAAPPPGAIKAVLTAGTGQPETGQTAAPVQQRRSGVP